MLLLCIQLMLYQLNNISYHLVVMIIMCIFTTNIHAMRRYKNLELERELLNGSHNYTLLSKKYSTSRITVRNYAKQLGVHKGNTQRLKTHTLNIDYFKSIDTPNKAYTLGFIYADGCNTRKGLAIGLQEKDKEVLEFIKKELEVSDSLRYIPAAKPTWSNKFELRICSKELSNDLINLGCPPAKSLILKFPEFITENLMSHFIRGYFDGDGSIIICSKGYARICFVSGSYDFIEGLQKYLYNQTGCKLNMYSNNGYSLQTSKQSSVELILNHVYTDSTFCMSRKLNKANEFMLKKGGHHLISITQR